MSHRVLVTGGSGQLGRHLAQRSWPEGMIPVFPERHDFDLTQPDSIRAYVASEPWVCIINCAAFTAVDRAEDDPAMATLVNGVGPAILAEVAAAARIPLIHISTDYVFDGTHHQPYPETAPPSPLGMYGSSKLLGELMVRARHPTAIVLRTAWLVSALAPNFVTTMLRAGADRPVLRVVDDQRGNPTSAADLAGAIVAICSRLIRDPEPPCGTYHFVNAGEATWYELACAIFEHAGALGAPAPLLQPIATHEYPTRARRPADSRLDTSRLARTFGINPRPWRDAVRDIVHEVVGGQSGLPTA